MKQAGDTRWAEGATGPARASGRRRYGAMVVHWGGCSAFDWRMTLATTGSSVGPTHRFAAGKEYRSPQGSRVTGSSTPWPCWH